MKWSGLYADLQVKKYSSNRKSFLNSVCIAKNVHGYLYVFWICAYKWWCCRLHVSGRHVSVSLKTLTMVCFSGCLSLCLSVCICLSVCLWDSVCDTVISDGPSDTVAWLIFRSTRQPNWIDLIMPVCHLYVYVLTFVHSFTKKVLWVVQFEWNLILRQKSVNATQMYAKRHDPRSKSRDL